MELADKLIISCLLLAEGADPAGVKELVFTLEDGIAAGEADSVAMHAAFMARAKDPSLGGIVGQIMRVLVAKRDHDEISKRFGMACAGLDKALKAATSHAHTGLAARILLARALEAVGVAASVSVAAGLGSLAGQQEGAAR